MTAANIAIAAAVGSASGVGTLVFLVYTFTLVGGAVRRRRQSASDDHGRTLTVLPGGAS